MFLIMFTIDLNWLGVSGLTPCFVVAQISMSLLSRSLMVVSAFFPVACSNFRFVLDVTGTVKRKEECFSNECVCQK